MKLLVGLGNPGEKFIETRHNTGFLVIDKLKTKITNSKLQFPNKSQAPNFKLSKKINAEVCQVDDLILVKPQTFMNESGTAVKKIKVFYKVKNEDIWVIHDDLDIALGEYKIQFGRSSAGHKGVQSVIDNLKTQDFWRVRIGIGPKNEASEEFVLEKFRKEEKEVLEEVIKKIVKIIFDELESLLETEEILAIPGALEAIKKGKKEAESGQGTSLEDLEKECKL